MFTRKQDSQDVDPSCDILPRLQPYSFNGTIYILFEYFYIEYQMRKFLKGTLRQSTINGLEAVKCSLLHRQDCLLEVGT